MSSLGHVAERSGAAARDASVNAAGPDIRKTDANTQNVHANNNPPPGQKNPTLKESTQKGDSNGDAISLQK